MIDLFAAGFIIFCIVLVIWEKCSFEFKWQAWNVERKDYLDRLERRYDEFRAYVDKSHFGMIPSVQNMPEVVDPDAELEQQMRDDVEKISQQETLSAEDIQKIANYDEKYGNKT